MNNHIGSKLDNFLKEENIEISEDEIKERVKNMKKEMYKDLNRILCRFSDIPKSVKQIARNENYWTKGQNDSFKLGYLIELIDNLQDDVNNMIEEFDEKYGEEFEIEDYVLK